MYKGASLNPRLKSSQGGRQKNMLIEMRENKNGTHYGGKSTYAADMASKVTFHIKQSDQLRYKTEKEQMSNLTEINK
jgi:hypothetical protein